MVLPLLGTGAKYGASVSINKRSKGIFFTIPRKSLEFLKVTMPEIEIYKPKSNTDFANSSLAVKQ